MSGNLLKLAFFEGVGHFDFKFQMEGGIAHQPLLVSEKQSDCPFVWYQNISSALYGFCRKACVWDGQAELRQLILR